MRRQTILTVALAVALLVCVAYIAGTESKRAIDNAYSTGKENGTETGYSEGSQKAILFIFSSAYSNGVTTMTNGNATFALYSPQGCINSVNNITNGLCSLYCRAE